jgi:hypothetical protein
MAGNWRCKKGLAWIYNTLWGPKCLPDEAEKDACAHFDRKYAPVDEELMALHRWFWEQSAKLNALPQSVKESEHVWSKQFWTCAAAPACSGSISRRARGV